MSRKQFMKPRDGLVVRDPLTMKPLPPDGVDLELTPYWRRRERDGDIVKASRPSARASASPRAGAEKEA